MLSSAILDSWPTLYLYHMTTTWMAIIIANHDLFYPEIDVEHFEQRREEGRIQREIKDIVYQSIHIVHVVLYVNVSDDWN